MLTNRASDLAVPSPEATNSTEITSGLDEDTDAYDVAEKRPRGISLSSQLQSLRELVRPNPRGQSNIASARNPLLNCVFPVELPRPARLKALLDVYFRDLDAYFPFLDRKPTENRILQTLTKLGYSEGQYIVDVDFRHHSTIALLCNMIAVAECFCSADLRTEDLRPGWSSFIWGRKLIQSSSSPKYVDLDLIRYHALSAEYLMQSELLQAASQAISNATQLAMLERLNDERSWQHLPKQEGIDRKLLWWIIYFLDRKIAQRLGAPYIIRDVEVAVSEFSSTTKCAADEYMQALVNQAKLWTQIWDTFFAAVAATRPADWREIEVMDTRILIAQRELPDELTWETGLLNGAYLARGEPEPQIRRRISLFIVLLPSCCTSGNLANKSRERVFFASRSGKILSRRTKQTKAPAASALRLLLKPSMPSPPIRKACPHSAPVGSCSVLRCWNASTISSSRCAICRSWRGQTAFKRSSSRTDFLRGSLKLWILRSGPFAR